jgi:membrane-bound lytic murein transglycosylase A
LSPPEPRTDATAWPAARKLAILLTTAAAWGGLGFAGGWMLKPGVIPPPPVERLALTAVRLAELPGWAEDRVAEAMPALARSCARLLRLPADRDMGIAGTAADWQPPCRDLMASGEADEAGARRYLERWFTPFLVAGGESAEGLFTGYYEAELHGARRPGGGYEVPLYRRPPGLVSVDLGLFRPELKGRRIAGKVVGGRLRPFDSRARIEAGALAGRGLELLWVDDPVDAFFLQVQGSGRVIMADGSVVRVGFDGSNDLPYLAIGRSLIEAGSLDREHLSMRSIGDWLRANPGPGRELMASNARFVFFRELAGDGPVGAGGVALTPGRSLAVDRAYLPLGVPIWLDTHWPGDPARPLRRLLVAQDTGAAIKGPVRGDLFWGFGAAALAQAGRMRARGRYYLLLPHTAAARRAKGP